MPERGLDLERACAADMHRLHTYVEGLRKALASVDTLAGPQTWSGKGGDSWRHEWQTRRKAIESALSDAEAQAPHLVAMARRADEDQRRQTAHP